MALNFAETFLRESGSAQDRAAGMAEMQLRAKQFADQMADQAARTAITKSEVEARIAQMNLEMDIAEETRGLNKAILEAQVKLSEHNANVAEIEEKRLKESNRDLTPEEIKRYGVPEGTKLYEAKDVLELEAQAAQNKLFALNAEAQEEYRETIAGLSSAIEEVEQQPIEEAEVYQHATKEERMGFFDKMGSRIEGILDYASLRRDSSPLGSFVDPFTTQRQVAPEEEIEAYRQRKALRQKERELGVTTEGQQRIVGQSPISLQDPEIQNLYQQLVLSRRLFGDPALFEQQGLQALIGGQQGLIQGLPPFRMAPGTGLTFAPGTDLSSFMQPPSEE